jgi:hypothetical protein
MRSPVRQWQDVDPSACYWRTESEIDINCRQFDVALW